MGLSTPNRFHRTVQFNPAFRKPVADAQIAFRATSGAFRPSPRIDGTTPH